MTTRRWLFSGITAIGLVAGVACGGGAKEAKPAPSRTPAAAAATTATATARAQAAATTREVEHVKSLRPAIDRLAQTLRGSDVAAARQAYEAYDARWNGIEVYFNVRSRDIYNAMEHDFQDKIAQGLEQPQPKLADLVPLAEGLGRKYDEALALAEKGPALSPLFDDLAALRIVRADLRITTSAINANDLPKARTSFAAFSKGFPSVEGLIKARSASAHQEVTEAIAAANTKLQAQGSAAAEVKPLVATVTDRYNFGVNLLNAAARNADLKKQTYSEADLKTLGDLNALKIQLRKSLAAWEAKNYAEASTAAAAASGDAFARVQPALAEKSADANVKTALGNYASAAVAGGDAAKVRAANKAALEAVAVAEQAVAGQFWNDPKLKAAIEAMPKA